MTRTLPVEFASRAGAPFVPAQGVLYPRPTVFCRPCGAAPKKRRAPPAAVAEAARPPKPTSARTRDAEFPDDETQPTLSVAALELEPVRRLN